MIVAQLLTPTPAGVEQPPSWLQGARAWLVAPPEWVTPLLLLVALCVAVSVVYRLHTRGTTREVREGIVRNACTLAACGSCTWAATRWLPLGYVGDVLVGAGVGIVIAWISTPYVIEQVELAVADYREREATDHLR